MIREEWSDWALDVATATNYGFHEVLDCVELLEERAEEEVIKNLLPALLGAMGCPGVKARPSDLIRGLFLASDLVETAGAVFQALLTGVKEGVPAGTRLTGSDCAKKAERGSVINPSTCKGPNIQQAKMCPMFRRCESEFKSHLCDDPPNGSVIRSPLCAVCGSPLIVSPEEPDARGSYNPLAACNYCKRHGRLEDLKRGD